MKKKINFNNKVIKHFYLVSFQQVILTDLRFVRIIKL